MQQAVVWDLGWALVAPQNGDWSRTTRFEELFPAWREQYTPEQFAAAPQATVLILAVTICGINLIVDILYGLVDPRVRVSQKGGQA